MQGIRTLLCAALIGVVEGISEWLPISSTGHMLLLNALIGFDGCVSAEFFSFFTVAIQFGAALAILPIAFSALLPFKKERGERKEVFRLWLLISIGMLPVACIGIPLDDLLEKYLYKPFFIALALIFYGILFIVVERHRHATEYKVVSVHALSFRDAFFIGCFQVLSLIPGTSRSGSTILGGLLLGISRTASAEFSFYMALPIMLGASAIRLFKDVIWEQIRFSPMEYGTLAVGIGVSFVVSYITIRFLLNFVKKHSLEAFGWYRILLGVLVIIASKIQHS